jgi:hypothetical protein
MSAPLPRSIERAALALIAAVGVPAVIQVTVNVGDQGQIESVEPRLKLKRRAQNARDSGPESA